MWRKSTYCGANGTCTELQKHDSGVAIRDSKFPEMPHLILDRKKFRSFIKSIKDEA